MIFVLVAAIFFMVPIQGLNNGLALTPPMGWMHWQRFRCLTNCEEYPDECISENLFRSMADRLEEDGYLEAGYEYLIIDDCWLATERDANGRLQPDPERFPSGIKNLSDYVHSKGLKFGIYEDYGTKTCGGYPGSLGYLERDANTFAEWGVDYLKLDGCYVEPELLDDGYTQMSVFLNATGRPIVFSCSFPAYQGLSANYSLAVEYCNLWRNYADIDDSWSSVQDIAKWFSTNQAFLYQYVGPGHWNDADMLVIGNYGLSLEQSKSQMTIWAILASPLIMSVDLRTIQPEYKKILLNADAIRVNQDPMGIQGVLYETINDIDVWVRPILPLVHGEYSYAFGFVSNRVDGYPYRIEITLAQYGIAGRRYAIKNIFDLDKSTIVGINDPIVLRIPPTGATFLTISELP